MIRWKLTPEERYDRVLTICEVCDSLDWTITASEHDDQIIIDAPTGDFEKHEEFVASIHFWKRDLVAVLRYLQSLPLN